jgi:hypothetical protein
MMNKSLLKILVALSTVGVLCGCEGWNQHVTDHWEQGWFGKRSPSDWKVNNDRDAQSRIMELEKPVMGIPTSLPVFDANFEKSAYNAISHMLATAHPPVSNIEAFNSKRPVLYSTTVDLNDYRNTTNFGRLHAELFASSLQQHWQNDLIKMTLRESTRPIIPQEGEFLLSREVKDLADDLNAGAVLVTTYSVALDKVYFNLQLINIDSNSIVATSNYNVPLGPRATGMLQNIEIPSETRGFLQ